MPLPSKLPFGLMHAKVALLGFRAVSEPKDWRLRLIVSTGNWTRATLDDSLDLAWTVEIASGETRGRDATQNAVDVAAAADFLQWLRGKVPSSPLDAAPPVTREAMDALDQWVADLPASLPKPPAPRFIDSRSQALLPQICDRIPAGPRNYLSIGSGFYESATAPGLVPSVLDAVVAELQKAGALKKQKPWVDLYVNPEACQAVATAVDAIAARGWTIRRAVTPKGPSRFLHAKFLFAANWRDEDSLCANAWLYLGSGNLTPPGMMRAASAGGNLEAGVVLRPRTLTWEDRPSDKGHPVRRLLPIAWSEDTRVEPGALSGGEDMPDRPPAYLAPPVPYLLWRPDSPAAPLRPPEPADSSCDLLDPTGRPCRRIDGGWEWAGEQPVEVTVSWSSDGRALTERVPVIGADGRMAARPLPSIAVDEVWWALSDFPLPPSEPPGDEETTGGDGTGKGEGEGEGRGTSLPSSYPVRRIMELVERIADRQTAIHPLDWTAWCVRLGQTLEAAKDDPAVAFFRSLSLNPLGPLRAAPFRPDFSLAPGPDAERYERTLDMVERGWQVNGLDGRWQRDVG
ncbi:hypothetical protein Rumeso_04082 [Rubellimicrobium mesophilum DSM 19309]|uniref:Uncharacterized protein n=1 Tax=Rubellimicrobium mesophilum DSM 19309 TaxID=442562 RepID=A0A017HIR8_9RHOB|nr:hypothetical protein [Rubellimicrobium mesophilum]EYD74397.1 hypothetical protein Rumeso_04082 [Rubellimicrobium mesophilum DSM 19309]